ncbi:hypothetical protein OVN18_03365 [Microcella daejeonensis]|uniref:Uncharacterized protein n=1 Tax=Microcella daejeonensis TaxID=2994971 RepID=A0A9E8MLY2_9MICO|nr:hypothetical protein [Microcella daejeonensis]WAB82060.1 hypothetical protein OVN18_03365 [Microcella daejeonensis]
MDAALDLPGLHALALAAAAGDARARAVRRIELQPEHPDVLTARLAAARLDAARVTAAAGPAPRSLPDAAVDDRWAALLLDLAGFARTAIARLEGARLARVEREGSRAVVTIALGAAAEAPERAFPVSLDPADGPAPVGLLFDLAHRLLEEGHPIGDG